jgi:hypothetical protein
MNERNQEEKFSTADFLAGAERPDNQPATNGGAAAAPERAPLFSSDEGQEFRNRWSDIQAGFVDEPRKSVERADELVAAAIKRLAEIFADERNKMEHDWDRGEDVSTEDLRLALRRYRSFFDRLLSV